MKTFLKIAAPLILLMFFFAACEKNFTEPIDNFEESAELSVDIDLQEVEALDAELAALDSTTMGEIDTAKIKRHLWRAMDRLDAMLDRVRLIVMPSQNDSAKALFGLAKDAQHNALEAARIDSFRLAFDYIHESRYYAKEAVKLIREENKEQREELIARLRQRMEDLDILLDEVRALLDVTPNERAQHLYERGRCHQGRAVDALLDGHLRDALFHIIRAEKYGRRAMHILTGT